MCACLGNTKTLTENDVVAVPRPTRSYESLTDAHPHPPRLRVPSSRPLRSREKHTRQTQQTASGTAMEVTVVASAPGKVILFGEHAVVYGKTAVGAAVSDLRIVVTAVSFFFVFSSTSRNVVGDKW